MRILTIALSARMLAQLAVADGYEVIALDRFGDVDLRAIAPGATAPSNDALAAVAVLKKMPEIDAKHLFLEGFSLGGTSSLLATDTKNRANQGAGVAALIAYYPFCYDGFDPSVPVLALIGEKDDWTPAAKCRAVTGKSNFELVVYPGITHAFTMPFPKPVDVLGHHLVYDEKSAQDAQQRADAFFAAASCLSTRAVRTRVKRPRVFISAGVARRNLLRCY